MSRDAYFTDEKTIDAVERCLQRISEAAYKLGSYLDDIYPDAPRKNARGVGNILQHKYDQVTEDLIWASIEEDIPRLRKSALREIGRLKQSEGDTGTQSSSRLAERRSLDKARTPQKSDRKNQGGAGRVDS